MSFTIDFSGSVSLRVSEIWPDGDAPDNPTVEDVMDKMRDCGSKSDLLEDWNIRDYLNISVHDDNPDDAIDSSIEKYW